MGEDCKSVGYLESDGPLRGMCLSCDLLSDHLVVCRRCQVVICVECMLKHQITAATANVPEQ